MGTGLAEEPSFARDPSISRSVRVDGERDVLVRAQSVLSLRHAVQDDLVHLLPKPVEVISPLLVEQGILKGGHVDVAVVDRQG